MKKFTNPNDPENVQLKSTLKRWISEKLVLSQEAVIEIEEHNCTEVSCVYAETVFTIKNTPDVSGQVEGVMDFYKIAKPLVFIRKWDIEVMKRSTIKLVVHKH